MRLLVPLPFDISNQAHGRNLRIAHLLQAMHASCEVLCLTPDERTAIAARDVMPGVMVQSIGSIKASSAADRILQNEPYLVRRSLSFLGCDSAFARAVQQLVPSTDVVAGFDMPSVAYLLAAADARGTDTRPRIVCDLIDDPWLLRQSAPWRYRWSPAGLKAAVAMQVIRHRVLPRFDALVAVAPQDAATIAGAATRPTTVVPNGAVVDALALTRWPREPLVVFTGSMNFPANEKAACFMARKVWPLVLASCRCGLGRSDAPVTTPKPPTLAIVGANPSPAVRALATLPNVIVTGRVPCIREWLERAQVAVAPMLSGTGIKNKILEASAAGCPVVATSMAVGGLPSGEDVGIIVADDPERIAAEVVRFLADAGAARRVGSAGLEMTRTRFSWSVVAAAFLAVLRNDPAPIDQAAPVPLTAENEEALAHAAP